VSAPEGVARQVVIEGDAMMLPYGRTLDVVVDPERGPELAKLAGRRRETAFEVPIVAVLWRDRKSLDDRYATQVLINLYPVGRLSREDAAAYAPALDALFAAHGLHGACEGRIIAGWPLESPLRPGKGAAFQECYRVKLWLAPPEQLGELLDIGTPPRTAFDPRLTPMPEIPWAPPERFAWRKERRGCLPFLAMVVALIWAIALTSFTA
jgi:hypothetical protein